MLRRVALGQKQRLAGAEHLPHEALSRSDRPLDEGMRALGIGGVQQLVAVLVEVPDDGGLSAADLPDNVYALVQGILDVGRAVDDGLDVADGLKMLK